MFVTNYYQSNVITQCVVIFIPKHSFCNTVCICMVMQIKLVVGVINLVEPKCQTPTYQKFYIIRCILVWNVVADELNLCVKGNLHSYYRISLNRIKLC